MKIGYTSIGFLGYNMEGVVEFLRDVGYDALELIYYPENWRLHVPSPTGLMKRCAEVGLELASFRFISGTDDESLQTGRELINLGYSLGCKVIDVKIESPVPEEASEDDYKAVVNALQVLGSHAGKVGMTLVVETHAGVLHESARVTKGLLEQVGMDCVKVNYDQANLTYAGREGVDEALLLLKDLVGFCHLKNGWFRNPYPVWTPLADGQVDNLKIISTLSKWGYDGYYMVEMPSGGDPFARAISDYEYLRDVEKLMNAYCLSTTDS